jgi:predicted outer membrane protein
MQMVRRSELDGQALTKLAATHSRNPSVQAFAADWRREQQKHVEVLAGIYAALKVDIPHSVDNISTATYKRLETLEGEKFDHAFIEAMQAANKTDALRFNAAARFVKTPAVVSYLNAAMPGLQQNGTKLKDLSASVSGGAAQRPTESADQNQKRTSEPAPSPGK